MGRFGGQSVCGIRKTRPGHRHPAASGPRVTQRPIHSGPSLLHPCCRRRFCAGRILCKKTWRRRPGYGWRIRQIFICTQYQKRRSQRPCARCIYEGGQQYHLCTRTGQRTKDHERSGLCLRHLPAATSGVAVAHRRLGYVEQKQISGGFCLLEKF